MSRYIPRLILPLALGLLPVSQALADEPPWDQWVQERRWWHFWVVDDNLQQRELLCFINLASAKDGDIVPLYNPLSPRESNQVESGQEIKLTEYESQISAYYGIFREKSYAKEFRWRDEKNQERWGVSATKYSLEITRDDDRTRRRIPFTVRDGFFFSLLAPTKNKEKVNKPKVPKEIVQPSPMAALREIRWETMLDNYYEPGRKRPSALNLIARQFTPLEIILGSGLLFKEIHIFNKEPMEGNREFPGVSRTVEWEGASAAFDYVRKTWRPKIKDEVDKILKTRTEEKPENRPPEDAFTEFEAEFLVAWLQHGEKLLEFRDALKAAQDSSTPQNNAPIREFVDYYRRLVYFVLDHHLKDIKDSKDFDREEVLYAQRQQLLRVQAEKALQKKEFKEIFPELFGGSLDFTRMQERLNQENQKQNPFKE